jgi:subtilase family serine protease
VAADAATVTGALIALDQQGTAVVKPGGGTSAAAPLWAALAVLADQQAGRRLGFLNTALYRIGRGASAGEAFHDITAGDNTVRLSDPTGHVATIQGYEAGPGWDAVTGWGSPRAATLVPMLIQAMRPSDGAGL